MYVENFRLNGSVKSTFVGVVADIVGYFQKMILVLTRFDDFERTTLSDQFFFSLVFVSSFKTISEQNCMNLGYKIPFSQVQKSSFWNTGTSLYSIIASAPGSVTSRLLTLWFLIANSTILIPVASFGWDPL